MWKSRATTAAYLTLLLVSLFALTQADVYPPRLTFYVQVRGKGRKQISSLVLPANEVIASNVSMPRVPEVKAAIPINVAPKPSAKGNNSLASLAKRWSTRPSFVPRLATFRDRIMPKGLLVKEVKLAGNESKSSSKTLAKKEDKFVEKINLAKAWPAKLWSRRSRSVRKSISPKRSDPSVKEMKVTRKDFVKNSAPFIKEMKVTRKEIMEKIKPIQSLANDWSSKLSQKTPSVHQLKSKLQRALSKNGEDDDSYMVGWYILCFSVGFASDILF